jgi:hypothetical protein
MIKLIEADIDLHFSTVRHDDLESRNVMLSTSDSSTTSSDGNLRLCILEFACCGLSKDQGREGPDPLVRNPLHYWVGQSWYSDWGWLPPREKAVEWMWKTWGNGGEDGKYVVVERDPKSRRGKPKMPIF